MSAHDVAMVQNLLERSLRLYMSKEDVVKHLEETAKIEPTFTRLVWSQLEKSNPEFFKVYHMMVRLKSQIIRFNAVLERQYEWMRKNGKIGERTDGVGASGGRRASREPSGRGGDVGEGSEETKECAAKIVRGGGGGADD